MNPNGPAAKKASQLPFAHVVSEAQGRLRFKIPERVKDKPYFASLVQSLSSLPEIKQVRANPMTGSVLVIHESTKAELLLRGKNYGLFCVNPPQQRIELSPHVPHVRVANSRSLMDEVSGLAGITLLSLATLQATRGKFLPAGLTLVFQASEFLKSWNSRPSVSHLEPLSEGL